MTKTYNLYCDESCHLEHDDRPYMLIAYVGVAYHQKKKYCDDIRALKYKHYIKGEIKWSALSSSRYGFYKDLIDYFFSSDLQFRAIVIDKSLLKHEEFNQSHDDFYNKMYYQLLIHKLNPDCTYNIYLDIMDTNSFRKAANLKTYLNKKIDVVRNLQVIHSYESELMQLADVLMGAIAYSQCQNAKVYAKTNLIQVIEEHIGHPIAQPTKREAAKFNLFTIDLK